MRRTVRRRQRTVYSPLPRHSRHQFNGVTLRSIMYSVPLLDELETALSSGNFDRRNQILTSVTDLFINGAPHFSEDQISIFDDVIARLISTIEAEARAKLADRL